MNLHNLGPYLAPLIVAAVLFIRFRRGTVPRPVNVASLWIIPAIAVVGIGSALWFAPHPDLTPLAIAVFCGATLLGIATGTLRARTLTLAHDTGTGRVTMQTSSYAFLLLAALVGVRATVRQYAASSGMILVDATLLFALGMIVTQRLTIWQRVRALQSA